MSTLEMDPLRLINIGELASLTGLSVGALYHMVSEHRIPVIRLSARCIRFRRSDIEAWISEKAVAQDAAVPVGKGLRSRKGDSDREKLKTGLIGL